MEKIFTGYFDSPVGVAKAQCNDSHLLSLKFVDKSDIQNPNSIIELCFNQLNEYFKGVRQEFTIPLNPIGTQFQTSVWNELSKIPYGEIKSYKDIAIAIGNPHGARAVGGANNKNPISIIIPCHRVIGKSGKLIGYGGGLWRKELLLQFEKSHTK